MFFIKKERIIDVGILVLFLFSFFCFSLFLIGKFKYSRSSNQQTYQRTSDDEFDSSLLRLNSVDKIMSYCDSFCKANNTSRTFPEVVSETLRKKFYHAYSYYSLWDNAMGAFFEPIVKHGATANVIPDDIAGYPYAACSQQSILGMEIFKRKGYSFRKVGMFDPVEKSGHFAYEVYYEKEWHFFDTDQEPDVQLLHEYKRPSAAFLAANPDIVLAAYRKKVDPQLFKRLLMNYKLGPVNKFPAPNAYLYQVVTKYFTYFGWIFFLLIIVIRYRSRSAKIKSSGLSSAKKENQVSVFS